MQLQRANGGTADILKMYFEIFDTVLISTSRGSHSSRLKTNFEISNSHKMYNHVVIGLHHSAITVPLTSLSSLLCRDNQTHYMRILI